MNAIPVLWRRDDFSADAPSSQPIYDTLQEITESLENVDTGDKDIGAKLDRMEMLLDDYTTAVDRDDDGPAGIVPVGSNEPLPMLMDRAGFLNGEVLVIMRESDYKAIRGES